jgi:hypothetical protein
MSDQYFTDDFVVLETGAKIIPLDKWIQFHQPMFGKPTIGGGLFTEQHAVDMYNIFVQGLSQPKKEQNV